MTLLDRDFVQGNILDEVARLGARLRVLEETLLRPASALVAIYETDAGQSIADGTWTVVDYETVVVDTHEAVATGASWTFRAPEDGYYLVTARVSFEASATWGESEQALLSAYVDGAQARSLDENAGQDFSGLGRRQKAHGAAVLSLAAGQVVDLRTYQDSGGALALHNDVIHNYVAIVKVK